MILQKSYNTSYIFLCVISSTLDEEHEFTN